MNKEVQPATNSSGIIPCGDRVVVKPDEIERVTEGGIVIPDTEAEKHAGAQTIGTLIAAGPDAWSHHTEYVYRGGDLAEVRITGYSDSFAKAGDRVAFAKYGGLAVEGEDGKQYRILNDEDITAIVSDGVNFTDIKSRKAFNQ